VTNNKNRPYSICEIETL